MTEYFSAIFNHIKGILDYEEKHFWDKIEDPASLLASIMNGTFENLPLIILSERDELLVSRDQSDMDLKAEAKADILYNVTVVTKDIDDIINIESSLQNALCYETPIVCLNNSRSVSKATLVYDKGRDINRKTMQNMYQSVIGIKASSVIVPKTVMNPIKVELDKSAQKQVMKQLSFLEKIYDGICKQISSILKSPELRDCFSKEDKIFNMSPSQRSLYEYLIKQREDVETQIKEMYTFSNLCAEPISIKDNGFKSCYDYILETNCSITDATKHYKEQKDKEKEHQRQLEAEALKEQRRMEEEKRKEEEKNQAIERFYSKNGDAVINRYTDAVIEDLKKRLKINYPINYYGGSSHVEWRKHALQQKLKVPYIHVYDRVDFTFDYGEHYTNINAQGEPVRHRYSSEAVPMGYELTIQFMTKDRNQLCDLINQITRIYASGAQITVPDPIYVGEFCKLNVGLDPNIEFDPDDEPYVVSKDYKKYGQVYESTLFLNKSQSVYYVRKYNSEDIQNNQILQLRLVQLCEYLYSYGYALKDMLEMDFSVYRSFRNQGFELFGFLNSQEFKTLKACYHNGQPVDRNTFNNVFKKITTLYPSLYEKTMQGWSCEQIEQEIVTSQNSHIKRFLETTNLLGIPARFSDAYDIIVYDSTALKFYKNELEALKMCTIQTALDKYHKLVLEELERRRAEIAARRQERYAEEDGYHEERSAGGGILGTIVGTAVGTAIGNKASGSSNKKSNGRQCLWGTAMCPYGKKNEKGWTIHCNIGCPLWTQCGGR